LRKRRVKIKFISILFGLLAAGIFIVLVTVILDTKNALLDDGSSASRIKFKTHGRNKGEIVAEVDSIYGDQKGVYSLKNMVSSFTLSNGELLTICADRVKAVRKDKMECEFLGNVKLSMESGLLIETRRLFADFNKKTATGTDEVVIFQDDTRLSAKEYIFDMEKNTAILINDAKGFLKADKINADKLVICFDDMYKKSIRSMEAIGNAVYIADTYTLKAKRSILYSMDKVEAQEKVVLFYKKDGNNYDIRSDFMHAKINNGKLDDIEAFGSLIIKTKDVAIRADRGILKGDKINVSSNVIISGKHGNILGDVATLDLTTNDVFINKVNGQEKVVLFYKKDGDNYDIRSDSMRAKINNGKLDDIEAFGSLVIKTKDATIRADRGILKGDKINVSSNVIISGKDGNILGDAATLDLTTNDVFINKSSGVVNNGMRKS
jgi:lipopolysaccharide export system protein LptA